MPKGVYLHRQRTATEVKQSLRDRLAKMSIPEPNSGCWLFTGYVDDLGYGIIAKNKPVRLKAHRAAYSVFVADIPANMDVMHTCDVRCCVNPQHLKIGTHQDNMTDMSRKGRARNRYTGRLTA